jgi:hypothetical protein
MANLLQNLFIIIWCITSSVLIRTKTAHSLRPSNTNTVKKKENMRYLTDEDLLTRSSATEHEQFQYLKSGHVFCKGLFHDRTITNVMQPEFHDIFRAKELESWLHLTRVVCNDMELQLSTIQECKNILEQSSSPEDLPFLQLFHLWQTNKVANSIATSSSLGKIAAELMDVPSVRLYQDSLFVKEPGHGVTDWHFDMNMVPIDTNDYITCWIPLHNIPLNTLDTSSFKGQGLHYATGSHRDVSLHYCTLKFGFPICSWFIIQYITTMFPFLCLGYEGSNVDLKNRYAVEDHGAYTVGDCSFHSGWCLHR